MKRLPAVLFTLLAALPAIAEEAAPKFAAVKIEREAEVEVIVLEAGEVAARKKEIKKEDDAALDKWKADQQAFLADKANKGMKFLEPQPDAAKVSVAKTFADKAEAQAFAEELQRKEEGKYALVKITDTDGEPNTTVMLERKIKGELAQMLSKYQEKLQNWEKRKTAYYSQHGVDFSKNPFRDTKPTEPKLVKLKGGIENREKAEAELAKLTGGK